MLLLLLLFPLSLSFLCFFPSTTADSSDNVVIVDFVSIFSLYRKWLGCLRLACLRHPQKPLRVVSAGAEVLHSSNTDQVADARRR